MPGASVIDATQYPYRPASSIARQPDMVESWFARRLERAKTRRGPLSEFVRRVARFRQDCARLSDDEALATRLAVVRANLRREVAYLGDERAQCVAILSEVIKREIGLDPHDEQIMAAGAMFSGWIAEMATGEGKSLACALAAGVIAVSGRQVHVMTTNDYLAERDAKYFGQYFESAGLKAVNLLQGEGWTERKQKYRADVVYGANKEFAFDFLKDRARAGGPVDNTQLNLQRYIDGRDPADSLMMRGLPFVIIDEADSILIDEARTPLILSGGEEGVLTEDFVARAFEIADALAQESDYVVISEESRIEITIDGAEAIRRETLNDGPLWRSPLVRNEAVLQALSAKHLFKRDVHYLVREDKVQIIDEYTGRLMPDRMWSRGLHQMVEYKESCPLTLPRQTLARTTYQRFINQYIDAAGMTGTAHEAQNELIDIYRLPVCQIPTHRPVRRKVLAERLFATADEKLAAVTKRIKSLQRNGKPVLVGTRTIKSSLLLAEQLDAAGVDYYLLNADQDAHEAEVIARAGEPGRVTLATNMAGRGADIKLGDGVAARGGLYVIMIERHESARIDRQLMGRCARQGDPGVFQSFISLEDDLVRQFSPAVMREAAKRALRWRATRWFAHGLVGYCQRRAENIHYRMRYDLWKSDGKSGARFAFAGAGE